MKEHKLTDQDYRAIKDMALNLWKERSISHKTADDFVCRCYVDAVTSYCSARGLTLVDGKFYVKERDK